MAKRGPKKLPTKILIDRGSRRVADRPKNEPKPTMGIPDPPDFIKPFPIAMEEWYRKVKLLQEQGTLAKIDDTMLGAYCLQYALMCDAAAKIHNAKDNGFNMLVKTKNKNIVQSPILGIMNQATIKVERLAAEFGMSPSARSSINVPERIKTKQTKSEQWMTALAKQQGA
jgi:P27 family predicted phage terminase small subunit